MITTCTKCSALYDEQSREAADEPGHLCPLCHWRTRARALAAEVARLRGEVERMRPVVEAAREQRAAILAYMQEPAACGAYDRATTATEEAVRALDEVLP